MTIATLVGRDQYSRATRRKPHELQPLQWNLPQFPFKAAVEEAEVANSSLADRIGRNSMMHLHDIAEIREEPFHGRHGAELVSLPSSVARDIRSCG